MKNKISIRWTPVFYCILIPVFLVVIFIVGCAHKRTAYKIGNPYTNVDWQKNGQYKANFHTHTSVGEAEADPPEVIDRYKKLGYSILAITDHDDNITAEPTWPWLTFQRDPASLDMVAVQGNEISGLHHIGSYFNSYGNPDVTSENEAIEEIGRRGGLAVFNHPGRYDKAVEWYVDMFSLYDHLIGLEVYNRRDRYPDDRATWDAVLTKLIPERSIWGFANDDMHEPEEELGFSWNILVLPKLNHNHVRKAMEQGCFFYAHASLGHNGSPVPVVEAITVDERLGIIQIRASNYEFIEWISQGNIIHKGDRLILDESAGVEQYIRAEIHGSDGTIVGTQPFSLSRLVNNK